MSYGSNRFYTKYLQVTNFNPHRIDKTPVIKMMNKPYVPERDMSRVVHHLQRVTVIQKVLIDQVLTSIHIPQLTPSLTAEYFGDDDIS